MTRYKLVDCARLVAFAVLLATASSEMLEAQRAPKAAKKSTVTRNKPAADARPAIEPKAVELLKEASNRLAAARSVAFTAVVSYESPTRMGPPLIYTTKSEVVMQRPDKLQVITIGDGPASEFYYDGKTIMAFAPAEKVVAVASAPPTVDDALRQAYDSAAIYFPFADWIVKDPYKDIAQDLKFAFYIGQSNVVGGTTTDMVAYASEGVFLQIWIGAKDKLPRMLRAVYRDDPSQLRHQLEMSNWKLDGDVPPTDFKTFHAGDAMRIEFSRPDPQLPPGTKQRIKSKTTGKNK